MIMVVFLLYSFVTALISAVDPHVDASMILESAQAIAGVKNAVRTRPRRTLRSNAERR